jgi:hypothetical protein
VGVEQGYIEASTEQVRGCTAEKLVKWQEEMEIAIVDRVVLVEPRTTPSCKRSEFPETDKAYAICRVPRTLGEDTLSSPLGIRMALACAFTDKSYGRRFYVPNRGYQQDFSLKPSTPSWDSQA